MPDLDTASNTAPDTTPTRPTRPANRKAAAPAPVAAQPTDAGPDPDINKNINVLHERIAELERANTALNRELDTLRNAPPISVEAEVEPDHDPNLVLRVWTSTSGDPIELHAKDYRELRAAWKAAEHPQARTPFLMGDTVLVIHDVSIASITPAAFRAMFPEINL